MQYMRQFRCEKCNQIFESKRKGRFCNQCKKTNCITCKNEFIRTNQQIDQGLGKYCCKKCEAADSNHRFLKNGYWCIKAVGHPRVYEKDYYYEHILIMEKIIGRYLDTKIEIVHHKDGNKLNNNPDNLELKTRTEHSNYHWPVISTSIDVGIDHQQFTSLHIPMEIKRNGYKYLYQPDHILANHRGYVAAHRLIMEEYLNRTLTPSEIVIFKNKNKEDLRIENLQLANRRQDWQRGSDRIYNKSVHKGYLIEYGYVKIWNPTHPMARKGGYVLEHRLVMSQYLGRVLKPDEHIHHKNGNRLDNYIENLELVSRHTHPIRHLKPICKEN